MAHRRREGSAAGSTGSLEFLAQQYAQDDANLDALGKGEVPGATDPLLQELAAARAAIYADMPAAPTVESLGMAAHFRDVSDTQEITVVPEVVTDGSDTTVETASASKATVVPLRRQRFTYALLGAAAATLVIAGSGVVVQNAEPGSPFYGVKQTVFGGTDDSEEKNTLYVELASTLDRAQAASDRGDAEEAQNLLQIASNLAAQLQDRHEVKVTVPSTAFVETTEPTTVTVTQTQTNEVTVTQTQPAPEPVATPEPTTARPETSEERPTTTESPLAQEDEQQVQP